MECFWQRKIKILGEKHAHVSLPWPQIARGQTWDWKLVLGGDRLATNHLCDGTAQLFYIDSELNLFSLFYLMGLLLRLGIVKNIVLICERCNTCREYCSVDDFMLQNTGLFISPSGISELDCATTKTDTAERSISIGRESLVVFFYTRGLGLLPGSTARG